MIRRVWIVNQFANTPDVPGGTRQFELGQHLAGKKLDVSVFSSDYNLSKRQFLKLKKGEWLSREKVGGIDWHWLRVMPYKKNDWRRVANMLSFCLNFMRVGLVSPRPDLIIGSSPQLFAAFASFLVAKIRRSRFYFEVRDLWPQVLIDLGGRSPRSLEIRVLGALERILYRYSDRVIVLAKGSVDYVIERGADPRKIDWLPNSVQPEAFDVSLSALEAKLRFRVDPDRFCFMYTGAHGLANALHTVVEAARILDQEAPGRFQILLVGDGPDKASLVELGRDVKCLEFRDPIPKKQIPELLRAADGLILCLGDVALFRYGVSPNKLYDYYGAGKPVAVAVGGFINEEVESFQVGVTARPADARDLAKALLRLEATSSEERTLMGERARALANNTYSRHAVADRLWKVVEAQA